MTDYWPEPFDEHHEHEPPDRYEAADNARKERAESGTRGGNVELRQWGTGVVHVVQRHAGGTHRCLCGLYAHHMRILEDNLEPGEVRQRAREGADWCKNCLRWVARW